MIGILKDRKYPSDPVKMWKSRIAAEADELDEEDNDDEKSSDYNYLLGMPMWNMSLEKKNELLQERDKKVIVQSVHSYIHAVCSVHVYVHGCVYLRTYLCHVMILLTTTQSITHSMYILSTLNCNKSADLRIYLLIVRVWCSFLVHIFMYRVTVDYHHNRTAWDQGLFGYVKCSDM